MDVIEVNWVIADHIEVEKDDESILITSVGEKESQAKKVLKELKEANANRKVYTCDMYPESVAGIIESDGCFRVPICISKDYVETIWTLCIGYNICHIITMTEKEFIILSANKDMFEKYGIQIDECKSIVSSEDVRRCQLTDYN